MALNYLLYRHQVSLMRADAAAGEGARLSHRGLALGYARRIDEATRPNRGTLAPLVPTS